VIATTVSNSTGWLSFGDIAPGTYQLQYTPPAGQTLKPGTSALTAQFTVAAGQLFQAPNGNMVNTACFAAGTRILTADGRLVPVEALRDGDAVEVHDGSAARIVWIGYRTLDIDKHPGPAAVQPVLIEAGALGRGLPWRDLAVSPDHALYLDGHLIPAKALTNGFSIRQVERRKITYYHIELPSHAVLFAEGAPAESYLETGNRGAFENGGWAVTLHPDFAQEQRERQGCAPFAEAGPVVEAVRQRLLDRAAIATTNQPDLRVTYGNGGAVITSRSFVPGELFADPRDRRRLGVKVARLLLDGVEVPVDHPALAEGWHHIEQDGRWTDGAGLIPSAMLNGARGVRVEIAASGVYALEGKESRGCRSALL
jgi:hypothetical protein